MADPGAARKKPARRPKAAVDPEEGGRGTPAPKRKDSAPAWPSAETAPPEPPPATTPTNTPPPPPPGWPGAPDAKASEARTFSMLTHLSAFAAFLGIPFGHILGPIIFWLIKKDEHPLVNAHGRASLNFQITWTIYFAVLFVGYFIVQLVLVLGGFTAGPGPDPAGFRGIGAGIFGVFAVFILVLVVLGVTWLVLVIMASVKAYRGEPFAYPATIPFLGHPFQTR